MLIAEALLDDALRNEDGHNDTPARIQDRGTTKHKTTKENRPPPT